LEGMRPRQWVKNSFVLAGVVFGGKVGDPAAVAAALGVTGSFCLASGAAYLVNDVRDEDADRHNPRTAARPIPRGDLSPRLAVMAASLSGAAAMLAAAAVNWESSAAVSAYLVLNLVYSHGLKRILFLDVLAIAGGFVLRAAAGGLAVNVPISSWLLLCTGLLATFLALTKRRAELVALDESTRPRRHVLEGYSVSLLDELIHMVTPATLVAYALYAVNGARSPWMLLTVPFVMYGIFRVLFLQHRGGGLSEEPALVVWQDRPLLLCVVLWAICAAAIVAISGAAR
jgi:4-hydroxybenzoate polyprenyltransferase